MKTMHENQAEKDNMLNYISQLEVKITNASNKRKQVGQQQDLNFQKIQENKSNLSANSSNISDPEQQPQPKPIIKKNFESYTSNLLNKDFPGKKSVLSQKHHLIDSKTSAWNSPNTSRYVFQDALEPVEEKISYSESQNISNIVSEIDANCYIGKKS